VVARGHYFRVRPHTKLRSAVIVIVEADGAQHADSKADQRRTALLEGEGWRVVRFWDNEVLTNTEGVIEVILQALQET